MGVWTMLLSAGREITVVTERVDQLRAEVDALSQSATANTERLNPHRDANRPRARAKTTNACA